MTTGGRSGCYFLVLFMMCASARSVAARVIINELYYDHPGTDTGHEFIELINTGGAADISGASLEFHNGTGTTWSVVWEAPPATMIAADALFVVGGELVVPLPDAVVAYSLQNGPDAIRLVGPDGAVLDVVGYGGLEDPPFVEVRGVAAVSAGKSIARALDGVDSDDNAADFIAATPSPGHFNVARDDVSLELSPGTPARRAREAPGAESIAVVIHNAGLYAVAAGAVTIEISDSTVQGTTRYPAASNRDEILPGGVERVVVAPVLGDGYHWLEISAHYALDERETNDRASLLRRIGAIPVLVSEIWSSPRDGCPQFVEWMNAGDTPLQVAGFSMRDERARPVAIDVDSLTLFPGEWIAVTADVERLSACVASAPREYLFGVRGAWPTFNRSGGAVADSIVILDSHGIVVDAVAYPAVPSASAGHSLERVDLFVHAGPAVWRLSDAPQGCSPAMANRAYIDRPAPRGQVTVTPNPFVPARGELLHVAATPQVPVVRIDARVYDLEGHRLAALGGAAAFPALLVWDGRRDDGTPVRPGLYLIAVELFAEGGARVGVERVVVGCAGDPP